MGGEIGAFIGRMESMLGAALDADGVKKVTTSLGESRLDVDAPEVLELGGKAAAWVIKARRNP
jgi:hypothetical protein